MSLKYDYLYLKLTNDGLEIFEGVQKHIVFTTKKNYHATLKTPYQRLQHSIKMAA